MQDEEEQGLDYDMEDRMVTIVCGYEATVQCPVSLFDRIPFFKEVEANDNTVTTISVPRISQRVMLNILEWAEHDARANYKDPPMPLPPGFDAAKYADDQWVAEFLQSFSTWVLFKDIAQAANYLGMNILANYACAQISLRLKNIRSAEEMWDHMNVDGDLDSAGFRLEDFKQEKMQAQMEKEWNAFLEDS